MRAGRATVVAGVAIALAACTGVTDDGASATPTTSRTVSEGPVAATAVVPGDCLTDVVIGAAERAEVESATKVSCHAEHTLEIYATFRLDAADLAETEGTYPGTPRVVRAADQGCSDRFEELGADPDVYGIIALWPSRRSWAAGDRTVACAVFSARGELFHAPQLS